MKKSVLIPIFCVAFAVSSVHVWAAPPIGIKIMPEAVEWPLVRPVPYKPPKRDIRGEDIYELTFGVRRWLSGIEGPDGPNFQETLFESQKWMGNYGGYGVLGHGEDVFSRQGAKFRRLDRGR